MICKQSVIGPDNLQPLNGEKRLPSFVTRMPEGHIFRDTSWLGQVHLLKRSDLNVAAGLFLQGLDDGIVSKRPFVRSHYSGQHYSRQQYDRDDRNKPATSVGD